MTLSNIALSRFLYQKKHREICRCHTEHRPVMYWLALLVLLLNVNPALALKNPSQVYCSALGYEYKTIVEARGAKGLCVLPDAQVVSAWDFLRGTIAQEWNYCEKNGYESKTIADSERCQRIYTPECTVCILADKTEVEVTELMNLSFSEGLCGDGACTWYFENFSSCPGDCPSGGQDGYCDGVEDGIIDPDCAPGDDPDAVAGITVNPTSDITTTEFGGTGYFSIVLTIQPTSDVNIGLTSSDESEGVVNPATLIFTQDNWGNPHVATVTGVNDFEVDGDIKYTIFTEDPQSNDPQYDDLGASDVADVSVTNLDDAEVLPQDCSGGTTAVIDAIDFGNPPLSHWCTTSESITTAHTVTVQATAVVIFVSNKIDLGPGFSVISGGLFRAGTSSVNP